MKRERSETDVSATDSVGEKSVGKSEQKATPTAKRPRLDRSSLKVQTLYICVSIKMKNNAP